MRSELCSQVGLAIFAFFVHWSVVYLKLPAAKSKDPACSLEDRAALNCEEAACMYCAESTCRTHGIFGPGENSAYLELPAARKDPPRKAFTPSTNGDARAVGMNLATVRCRL